MFTRILVCIPAILLAVCSLVYADNVDRKINFAQSGEIIQVEQTSLRQCRDIHQIKHDINKWGKTFGKYMVQTQIDRMILEVSINEAPGINCTI